MGFSKTQKKWPAEKANLHNHSTKDAEHLSRENVRCACKFVFCTKTYAAFYTTSQLAKPQDPCYSIDTKGSAKKVNDPMTGPENETEAK